MIYGFTGTRRGMTGEQREAIREALKTLATPLDKFHHGCCVGADAQAHWIMRKLRPRDLVQIIGHRCHLWNQQDQSVVDDCNRVEPPLPPLHRNKNIVNISMVVFACPGEQEEVLRSGTWATIRYARKINRELVIIYPDGERGK